MSRIRCTACGHSFEPDYDRPNLLVQCPACKGILNTKPQITPRSDEATSAGRGQVSYLIVAGLVASALSIGFGGAYLMLRSSGGGSVTSPLPDGQTKSAAVQSDVVTSNASGSRMAEKSASAQDVPTSQRVGRDEWVAVCKAAASMAGSIMRSRQAGLSMVKSMELVAQTSSGAPDVRKLIEHIVMEAYDTPHYSSEAIIDRAINDFRDEQFLKCLKARKE
jgi:hypothetical protein